jgi:hypothetical protein
MAASAPEIIFGAAPIAQLSDVELTKYLNVLKKHKVTSLDTARRYVQSPEDSCSLWKN